MALPVDPKYNEGEHAAGMAEARTSIDEDCRGISFFKYHVTDIIISRLRVSESHSIICSV